MAAVGTLHVHVVNRRRLAWGAAFLTLCALLVARNLAALDVSPPGLYSDEASIGYNAWAVAHYGIDEHGARTPLYFQAFGEFKNPVYVYTLAALLRVLPLSAAVERLPAALFGFLAVAFLTLAAWRLTRSRPITLFTLALAALTPWIALESRVGFEVVAMVAALSGVLWALAGAERQPRLRHFALTGVFLAIAIYAYSTGRLEVGLYTLAFAAVYGARSGRDRRWLVTLVPVGAAYGVLAVWALMHPGALTARFSAISIGADGAPLGTVLVRFLGNYASYFTPDFLVVHGDLNPRHSTGAAGMLLWVMVPLLLAGLVVCWRRRQEALPRFLLLGLIVGPVAAAVTGNGGFPHALRTACMAPFWVLLATYGAAELVRLARGWDRRAAAAGAALLAAGLMAQGAYYSVDLFTAYPTRSAGAFDTGEEPAMLAASAVAQGNTIYLSASLDVPYIQAYFALTPAPPAPELGVDVSPALARLRMRMVDLSRVGQVGHSGDVLVLVTGDPVPSGAALVARASTLVAVYRLN